MENKRFTSVERFTHLEKIYEQRTTITSTLKITNVDHSDAGNFTRKAHNIYSNISETSQVFVYGM